jgi:sodium-independent sulfate anion transporter 11
MTSTGTNVGHGLAKVLGIKLQKPESYQDDVTRGESVLSVATTETFVEEPPTTAEWLREVVPTGRDVREYIWSLFPFLHWIGFYNPQWLIGDLVAGKSVRTGFEISGVCP